MAVVSFFVCGNDTVAPAAPAASSITVLLEDATASAGAGIFGGVFGGEGGISVWIGVRPKRPLNRACQASCCTIGLTLPGGPQLEIGRCGIIVAFCGGIGDCAGAAAGAGGGGSLTLGVGLPGGSLTSGWLASPLLTGCDEVSGGGGDWSWAANAGGNGLAGKFTLPW